MLWRLQRSDRGVASTVGTVLTLLVVITLLTSVSTTYVPVRMKDEEFNHMEDVLSSFANLRSQLQAKWPEGSFGFTPHRNAAVPITLGARGLPALTNPTEGILRLDPSNASSMTLSYDFIAGFQEGLVEQVDQDVVLMIDSSGSMFWNDPNDLRLDGAAEYIKTLAYPDRVAIVDFDHEAFLVKENVGGAPHHLNHYGHGDNPDYQDAIDDLKTIDSWGWTNFGEALKVSNDELINYSNPAHKRVGILLTDGWNNWEWQNTLAREQAYRAANNSITVYTIGLGDHDANLLRFIANTTGGTYYAAPDAESIKWIYLEISKGFEGESQCLCTNLRATGQGRISLEVHNRYYVPQTVTYESGAVVTSQIDGGVMSVGPDITVMKTSGDGARLGVGLTTVLGDPAEVRGFGAAVLSLNTRSSSIEEIVPGKTSLQAQSDYLGQLRNDLDDWASQGAVTNASAATLKGEIQDIETYVDNAINDQNSGNWSGAKADVNTAMNETDDAISTFNDEVNSSGIQEWLADSYVNDLLNVRCRLTQWINWAQGVTLRIATPYPEVWGAWFNSTLQAAGVDYTITFGGSGLTVVIIAVDFIDLRTNSVIVTV